MLRRTSFSPARAIVCAGSLSVVALACGSSSETEPPPDAATKTDSGTSSPSDASTEAAVEAEAGPSDGTPSYTSTCTPLSAQNGTAINSHHGRLDGYLAYVVPKDGDSSCNGDGSHVHLQVRMDGNIYDVAVDIGTFTGDSNLYEANMPIPGGAWSEGWHDIGLSYPQLGLHSTQFTPEDPTTLGQKIQSELAGVNHISVFGDGYSTDNGCHDVHYENGSEDGALILEPLSPKAHILFFRFSTQSF
jgi:hypothetical protein